MTIIRVKLQTAVRRTFRVEQVAGMFDLPLGQVQGPRSKVQGQGRAIHPKLCHELTAEVPGVEEKWTVGAIVGPSGSGKTTLAKAAFGGVYRRKAWPKDRAIIDCFPDVPVKELTVGLASAGLGSPPTWLKPYHVLSGGEKFRADLFRAVVRERGVVVIDEFSALLDRTVAKTASAAFARLLRSREGIGSREWGVGVRLVAVSCHRDVLPWLSPDWVIELRNAECGMRSGRQMRGELMRGRPRRVGFRFTVERAPQAMWTRFSGEHYLSGGLAASASCYAAFWNREAIGYCAVVACLGWKGVKRIQRLVVLPEFQGLGIGGKLLDLVAASEAAKGFRVTITASHPAVLAHCGRSERWRFMDIKKTGSTRQVFEGRAVASSVGRAVAAFEFVGDGTSR